TESSWAADRCPVQRAPPARRERVDAAALGRGEPVARSAGVHDQDGGRTDGTTGARSRGPSAARQTGSRPRHHEASGNHASLTLWRESDSITPGNEETVLGQPGEFCFRVVGGQLQRLCVELEYEIESPIAVHILERRGGL